MLNANNINNTLGAFLCIGTPNTGQLNPLFHTFAEFRPISGLARYNPIYYWLAASAQFSPNANRLRLDSQQTTFWDQAISSFKVTTEPIDHKKLYYRSALTLKLVAWGDLVLSYSIWHLQYANLCRFQLKLRFAMIASNGLRHFCLVHGTYPGEARAEKSSACSPTPSAGRRWRTAAPLYSVRFSHH